MKMEDMILVSLDDHLIEPPNMYEQHLTAAQKQFAPKFQTDEKGRDYWLYDGRRLNNIGLNAVVGKDKKQALTLLRAYNDWHVDEWCAAAPGRFIPNCLVPTWDMNATVAEVKRLSKKADQHDDS